MGKIKHFTRLKKTDEFDRVYKQASIIKHTRGFVLFYLPQDDYRVGFVAGKKIGKAVERNRAKRLLRAHFIESAETLKPGWYVWVAKKAILQEPYLSRRKNFGATLRKAGLSK